MGVTLTPILTSTAGTSRAYNPSIADTYSWLPVEGDVLGRPLYARASYITNFSDMAINLSASELSIGAVTIKDNNSGLNADVVGVPGYGAGLQVLTQDLESSIDDITIGDKDGNYAGVNSVLSALKVQVVNTDQIPNKIAFADSPNLDAFGRLRVSEPYSLFDSKTLHDLSPLIFNNILSGTGDAAFINADASVILSTNTPNSFAIRQTFSRFGYQPGKSQYALFTGVMEPQLNVVKRYGLFTSLTSVPYTPDVGLYFEASNDTISVWINNTNGGTSTTPSQSAARFNWNLDSMDGNGPSGINLSFDKAQIFLVDYEWLGVGRVRFGFVVEGKVYYCHEFNNANIVTAPYLFTPNLPVRAEIRQTGAGTGTFRVICQSVMSEGGHSMAGTTRSVYTPTSGLNINTAGQRRAVLGVRLQPNKLDSITEILNAYVGINPSGSSSVAHFRWEIVLNPTIGGTTPVWTNVTNSNLQSFVAADETNTVTGGTELLAGIGNVGTPIDITSSNFQRFKRLGCSINGIRDEIYLVVTPLVNPANSGVWGALTYIDTD